MRIAFLCRRTSLGVWSAESVNTGIGGSEEAVVHMAELLGRRGYIVSVHMPGAQHRRFGSVIYDDDRSLHGQVIDVAVMWRYPSLAEWYAALNFRARRAYLWLHDIIPAHRVLEYEHMYRKVIVLSNYHRGRYAAMPDGRILVSANGIDPSQFDGDHGERDPHLVVYGSAYGRGLATLLGRWPTIREHVPECRLNVFYGWQGFDAQRAEELHHQLDPLLRQPGVSHLGRIGHHAVASQYMRAGIWAYPSHYRETSCISAMKAQAGVAVPVVIPTGALRETVQFGFRTRLGYDEAGGADTKNELVREWLCGLIKLLRSPDEQSRIRTEMMPASKACYAWSTVADQWEREFSQPAHRPRSTLTFSSAIP